MNKWQQKYLIRFILGMLGYAILLALSFGLVGDGRVDNPWLAALVALLPIAPFLNAIAAIIHNVRSQDELKQRIHLEAVLVTTLITGSVTISYGLLETTQLVPHLPIVFIAPFMIFVWGFATIIISHRYN